MTDSISLREDFALDRYLERERARIEAALRAALARILPDLPRGLRGPVEHAVEAGGKRLRPILCVAAYTATRSGSPPEALYDLAVSSELIHTYSLMHDDLPCMDDARLRRGRPTAHTRYGEIDTTVAGATLIPLAGLVAWTAGGELGLTDERRRAVLSRLARAAGAGGMVGGQVLDLEGEGRPLTRNQVDRLHRMKTGALIAVSLEIGGIAAAASPEVEEALGAYGRRIGLAFQIADDVLDATSTPAALGKNPSDRALRKSTYVSLLGAEGARREALHQIEGAVRALEAAGVDSEPLRALARYVVDRTR